MAKKVCIFTGAGIGVPLGLPMTTGFDKIINQIDKELLSYLSTYLNHEQNDIEKILYVLEEFAQNSGFILHIINKNVSSQAAFTTVKNTVDRLINNAKLKLTLIKSAVYDVLEAYDSKKASLLYMNLITEIKELYPDSALTFFTTNYDLTFENTIYDHRSRLKELGIDDVYFGFETDLGRQLFTSSQDFKWAPNIIEYLKLHGSLDWSKDSNGLCAKSGITVKPAKPDEMPLLYLGYKGTPNQEPFLSIHERLYTRLIESEIALVIGFAFRDPYINSIFEFALKANKKLRIYCFNPCKINSLPAESSLGYFAEQFKNFTHVPKAISIEKTPLGLESYLKA